MRETNVAPWNDLRVMPALWLSILHDRGTRRAMLWESPAQPYWERVERATSDEILDRLLDHERCVTP